MSSGTADGAVAFESQISRSSAWPQPRRSGTWNRQSGTQRKNWAIRGRPLPRRQGSASSRGNL